MAFHLLTDHKRWSKKRDSHIQAARECRAALTDPSGHWRYAPTDPRVEKAVRSWIALARRAHAIAMGRKPLIADFTYSGSDGSVRGILYAREQ